jgi:K+-transporting ATPase KdpF subunit
MGVCLDSARSGRSCKACSWDLELGLLAAGLLVYLIAVLLPPEDFS